MLRAGNDIGGTFTDTVFLDEQSGEMHVGKVLTTPGDPSVGAIEGLLDLLEQLDAQPQQVRNIVHGTTLVANTLIERKGARTALLTTRGFRDILEARTEKRYELYDLNAELPEPLVPRDLRIEVAERMDESGQVVLPLDEESAALAVEQVEAEAVQAVAIGFLHSYKNPAHEREMRSIIRRRLPGMHVSLSAEVVPQIREYQRFSTTVANAYVQPLMDRYLSGLHDRLHQMGLAEQLYIMLSSGGITTSDVSREFPIRVVESGPAAGAIAGALYGSLLGLERVVTYDMGGTTAKICFVEAGHPMTTTEFEVARVQRFKKGSGLPIKVPVIDMLEIGAGGGSIARVDRMGLLKVV
ncbi:MAG: hydantoinase/oxoprolinase family protein, partial [Chloroflexi bacterium]|nr:hydantoinase/oxoprolinase family protein [Chloroflexota bacterium]